jgi:hypothetical protein
MKKATKNKKQSILSYRRQWGIVTSLVLLLAVFGFGVYLADKARNDSMKPPVQQGEVTVKGQSVCLPHKDKTGPQTLECAIGVKTAAGVYYGIENKNVTTTGMNASIEVTGTLIKAPNSKYDIAGVIRVDS